MPSVCSVVAKYQDLLRPKVTFSRRRHVLGKDGIPNITFIFIIRCHKEHFHSFLRELGLIKNEFNCPKCKSQMKIKPEKKLTDGCIWVCRNSNSGKACGRTLSVRDSSLFKRSKLSMEDIFHLTYDLVRGRESAYFSREYLLSEHTIVDWRRFVQEIMLSFIKTKSVDRIGGVGNIVEVYHSKYEERTFNKEDAVIQGQYVIGGIDRKTGKLFLVTVQDQLQDMLVRVIEEWIEKGTTIFPDSMVYKVLREEGFDQLTVNSSVIVDPSKSKLGQVKSVFFLAQLMFEKVCAWEKEDTFNKFLEVVAEMNWDEFITVEETMKTQK